MSQFLQHAMARLERLVWRNRRYHYIRVSESGPMPGIADRDWAGQLGALDEWMHAEIGVGGRSSGDGSVIDDYQ